MEKTDKKTKQKKYKKSELMAIKQAIDVSIEHSNILKLRESLDLLNKHSIIYKNEMKEFEDRLEKLIKEKHCFVTKKFKCCEAQSKTAYHFMMCLKSKFMKDQSENK